MPGQRAVEVELAWAASCGGRDRMLAGRLEAELALAAGGEAEVDWVASGEGQGGGGPTCDRELALPRRWRPPRRDHLRPDHRHGHLIRTDHFRRYRLLRPDHHRRRSARKGMESEEKEMGKGGEAVVALLAAVRLLRTSISCVAAADEATDTHQSCVASTVASRPPTPAPARQRRERGMR
uniref:Uncharacterized protein n=1 Tax=Oryza punctata TaxID=4537 RepID=A0A0E0MCJ9_ORYPU